MMHTGQRLTEPTIGWMLFENDIQTVLAPGVVWARTASEKHGR